ncbi:hypothetical protein KEM52_001842, partial [Ascosphaera acerosa]
KRIVIDEVEKRVGQGGAAYLRFKGAHCAPKDATPASQLATPNPVPQPAALDATFQHALEAVTAEGDDILAYATVSQAHPTKPQSVDLHDMDSVTLSHGDRMWSVANLTSTPGAPASVQMQGIAAKLRHILAYQSESAAADSAWARSRRTPDDAVFATVMLRRMADFAAVNEVYAALFTRPNPPARATVSCGDAMPAGCDVLCSFIFDKGPRARRNGLHVQSRSYWAPANIGPYSQAVAVPSRSASPTTAASSSSSSSSSPAEGTCVYIAGQIPLDAPTMEIPWGTPKSTSWLTPFLYRATLSLQHLWRIGAAMKVNWWHGAVAYLTDASSVRAKAVAAARIWQEMLKTTQDASSGDGQGSDVQLDAWDIKYGRRRDASLSAAATGSPALVDWNLCSAGAKHSPPFIAVEVAELPRSSDIEWQALGAHALEVSVTVQDVTLAETPSAPTQAIIRLVQTRTAGGGANIFCTLRSHDDGQLGAALARMTALIEDELKTLAATCLPSDQQPHTTLFATTAAAVAACPWKAQVVPCRSMWDGDGEALAAALVVHAR